MRIDPASAWNADLIRGDGSHVHFDTPRCALLAWRTGRVPANGASFQEFYERDWRRGEELRFALGSDVVGPMGVEIVPVDPSRAEKLARDHHASRIATLEELTAAVLESGP
jgi:hypothetical protein